MLQPPKAPPWATIDAGSLRPSGTVRSAVTAWDLFFTLSTTFSVSRPIPPNSTWLLPADQRRTSGQVGVEPLDAPVVEREDLVLRPLEQELLLQVSQHLGVVGCEVVGLGPVVWCVELPDGRRRTAGAACRVPRSRVPGDRGPALVVDAPVDEHLEVLGLVPLCGVGVLEGVAHAHALVGRCWMPCTNVGSGRPAASRTVGATSMTWWNWWRTSPVASMPRGQCTIVPVRVPP